MENYLKEIKWKNPVLRSKIKSTRNSSNDSTKMCQLEKKKAHSNNAFKLIFFIVLHTWLLQSFVFFSSSRLSFSISLYLSFPDSRLKTILLCFSKVFLWTLLFASHKCVSQAANISTQQIVFSVRSALLKVLRETLTLLFSPQCCAVLCAILFDFILVVYIRIHIHFAYIFFYTFLHIQDTTNY